MSTFGTITVDRRPVPLWVWSVIALVVVTLAAAGWLAVRPSDPPNSPYPYSTALPPETIVTPRTIDGRTELYLVDSDTGSVGAQITNIGSEVYHPALVPGRQSVAYQVRSNDVYSYLISASDGSDVKNLFSNLDCKQALQPSFNPKDIEEVALSCIREGEGFFLFAVRADSEPKELDKGGWIDDVTFSPDGTRIAYFNGVGVGGEPPGIYTVSTDGMQSPRWIADGRKPAWSPDGTQIAFRRPIDNGGPPLPSDAHIFLMNTDGSSMRQLTSGPGAQDEPTWSPDGSTIAFRSNRDRDPDDFSLWTVEIGSGSAHRVSPDDPASVNTGSVWAPR